MKTKEHYAQQIISECGRIPRDALTKDRLEAESRIAAEVALNVVNDIRARAKGMSKPASIISLYREMLTKWKAVVRLVKGELPNNPVTDNYIGILLTMFDPELFEFLTRNRVFLGYEFTPREQEILDNIAKADRENRKRNLLAFFAKLGGS